MAFTDKFDPEDYYMTEEGYIVFTENTTSSAATAAKAAAGIVRGRQVKRQKVKVKKNKSQVRSHKS